MTQMDDKIENETTQVIKRRKNQEGNKKDKQVLNIQL